MEYCYRLNLPPLNQVLTTNGLQILSEQHDTTVLSRVYSQPKEIFRQEWLTIAGHTWNQIFYFFRSNQSGQPHTDTIDTSSNVWAINWIWGGESILDIWNTNDPTTYTAEINRRMNAIWYNFTIPPEKTYTMYPGAYLVNVRQPHRATGVCNRHCFSLRCRNSFNTSWHDIVNSFSQYLENS